MKLKVSFEEIKRRLTGTNLKLIEQSYKGTGSDSEFECLKCSNIFQARLHKIYDAGQAKFIK